MNSKKIFFIIFLPFSSLHAMNQEQKSSFKKSFKEYYDYLVGSLDVQSFDDSPLTSPRNHETDKEQLHSSSEFGPGSLVFNLPQPVESKKSQICQEHDQENENTDEETFSFLKQIFCCFKKEKKASSYETIE